MRTGILIIAAVVIAAVILAWQQYSAEQTRQKGFVFGNELAKIQDDLSILQTRFYSSITEWEEGEITKEMLLKRLQTHLDEFDALLLRYDTLQSPTGFEGSVRLFRLSAQAQMESDREHIVWIDTGDEAAKIRSDLQLKESFDMEMAALAEYNQARHGTATTP